MRYNFLQRYARILFIFGKLLKIQNLQKLIKYFSLKIIFVWVSVCLFVSLCLSLLIPVCLCESLCISVCHCMPPCVFLGGWNYIQIIVTRKKLAPKVKSAKVWGTTFCRNRLEFYLFLKNCLESKIFKNYNIFFSESY